MLTKPGKIRTWLYTSEFKNPKTQQDVHTLVAGFRDNNKRNNVTGFLLSNGKTVMQLLEGDHDVVERLKATILSDDNHENIVSEVWELEKIRAYPHWSMRVVEPHQYEEMFQEIESAKIETIAINIARLLFDVTFDS